MATQATEGKPKSPRKRKRGRPRDETIHYLFEIKEWDWSFTFGMNLMRHRDDPYMDYRHLQLRGNLIRPAKLTTDGVDITLLPEHGLNEDKRERHEPKSVGSLRLYRGAMSGLLSMPSDALASVLQMVIADRLRYAALSGDQLRYGHAAIRSYSLDMKIDDDDLPDE
jgi:hypothetical protein